MRLSLEVFLLSTKVLFEGEPQLALRGFGLAFCVLFRRAANERRSR